jgi:four helix bundle protein
MLNFQKLDVYRCSIQFLAIAVKMLEKVPRRQAALADQLRRAAVSTPLNIAEGSGRPTGADAARHFGIARGSAMECAAIVDAFQVLGAIDDSMYRSAIDLLERTVSMLTKLSNI